MISKLNLHDELLHVQLNVASPNQTGFLHNENQF